MMEYYHYLGHVLKINKSINLLIRTCIINFHLFISCNEIFYLFVLKFNYVFNMIVFVHVFKVPIFMDIRFKRFT